ncbi:MAG: peptidylprolyl isomerase [Phycisphaerales bacterium JB037]
MPRFKTLGHLTIAAPPLLAASACALAACAAPASNDATPNLASARPSPASQPSPAGEPLATIDGIPVAASDLLPTLLEAVGSEALEEFALMQRLRSETAARGIAVTPPMIEAERRLLMDTFADAAGDSEARAGALLDAFRANRGLGTARLEALLERNAMLRALVAPEVVVDDQAVRTAYSIVHGPRYRVRLIVAPTREAASRLRNELVADSPVSGARFGEFAARSSNDPSAARGGLIEPISPADDRYPATLRNALPTLEPGSVSPVLAFRNGFALALLEESIPPTGVAFDDARPVLERDVRLQAERGLMDTLARTLLADMRIVPIDPSLDWSWRNRGVR